MAGPSAPFAKKHIDDAAFKISIESMTGLLGKIESTSDERTKMVVDRALTVASTLTKNAEALQNALITFDDSSKEFDKIAKPFHDSVVQVLVNTGELVKLVKSGDLDLTNKKLNEMLTTLERIQKLQQDPEMNRLLRQVMGGQL